MDVETNIAEYNMGQLDYMRIDELIKQCHNYAVELKMPGNMIDINKLLMGFCNAIYEIYKELRPAITKEKRDKYDKEFDKIFVSTIAWIEQQSNKPRKDMPWATLIRPMEELENEILMEKHNIMGFPLIKMKPLGQKIRSGLNA
jgi:hypothetical protein